MPDYAGFFFNSLKRTRRFQTLQISHPSFSQTYMFVRNALEGLTASLETGEVVTFQYLPMRIRKMKPGTDLDYGIGVDLGDLGEILPDELERARLAGTMSTRPTVIYREYRSDDLSGPMLGPITLQAQSITRTRQGASFEAGAPSLNLNKTGELYTIERFPMLRGFL